MLPFAFHQNGKTSTSEHILKHIYILALYVTINETGGNKVARASTTAIIYSSNAIVFRGLFNVLQRIRVVKKTEHMLHT